MCAHPQLRRGGRGEGGGEGRGGEGDLLPCTGSMKQTQTGLGTIQLLNPTLWAAAYTSDILP